MGKGSLEKSLCQETLNMITHQVAVIDTNYKYIFANNAYRFAHNSIDVDLHGHSLEEVIGTDSFKNVVKPKLDASYRGEEVSYTSWIKFRKKGFRFSKVKYAALHNESDQVIAIAIEIHDLTEQKQLELSLNESKQIIAEISTIDWLTELHNDNHFNTFFPKKIKIANRNGQLLAFGLLNIDHFNAYNTKYGRNAGDRTLKKIASSFKKILKRPNDYIFRLKEDEFAILFNVSEENDGKKIAEKIRKSIESLKIEHQESPVFPFVTISIGLTILEPDNKHSIDEIVKGVRKLLKSAKKSGKNSVHHS